MYFNGDEVENAEWERKSEGGEIDITSENTFCIWLSSMTLVNYRMYDGNVSDASQNYMFSRLLIRKSVEMIY